MGASTAMAAAPASGELVEFDIQRMRRQAAPTYMGGGGGGIDPERIRAMLDRMIEVLGFPNAPAGDHDLQTSLKLIRQLLRQNEGRLKSGRDLLWGYEGCIEDGDRKQADQELESLRSCLSPIEKTILY